MQYSSAFLFFFFLVVSGCKVSVPSKTTTACHDALTTSYPPTDYKSRDCGSNLTNLWLDIVIVVENTEGMTREGLVQVAAHASSVFSSGTSIGKRVDNDPRYSRVSIVTYNSDFVINADLNAFNSTKQFNQQILKSLLSSHGTGLVDKSFIVKGLLGAEEVLNNGRLNNYRSNYKQLVILYASSYHGSGKLNPVPVANRLKASGANIATIAFSQMGSESIVKQLENIATTGFGFDNSNPNIVRLVQDAAIQTNCHCPELWTQYRSVDNKKYGTCIRASSLAVFKIIAETACQNLIPNGHLVTEENQQKHDFVSDLILNDGAFSYPFSYFIGLSYTNGRWVWDQPEGQFPKALKWSNWNPGYPQKPFAEFSAVINEQVIKGNGTLGWKNVNSENVAKNYVCEVISCDTDNYC